MGGGDSKSQEGKNMMIIEYSVRGGRQAVLIDEPTINVIVLSRKRQVMKWKKTEETRQLFLIQILLRDGSLILILTFQPMAASESQVFRLKILNVGK